MRASDVTAWPIAAHKRRISRFFPSVSSTIKWVSRLDALWIVTDEA
jgi:hypothetical protein